MLRIRTMPHSTICQKIQKVCWKIYDGNYETMKTVDIENHTSSTVMICLRIVAYIHILTISNTKYLENPNNCWFKWKS